MARAIWFSNRNFHIHHVDGTGTPDFVFTSVYVPKSFSKILRKKTSIHRKCFFFLNGNILQRVIAHSVAQQSSFTWMHSYLPHFTCSDLGDLWLPSRKKPKLFIRVILSNITWHSVALMSSYLFWSEEVQSCRFRRITQQRTSINTFSQLRISF